MLLCWCCCCQCYATPVSNSKRVAADQLLVRLSILFLAQRAQFKRSHSSSRTLKITQKKLISHFGQRFATLRFDSTWMLKQRSNGNRFAFGTVSLRGIRCACPFHLPFGNKNAERHKIGGTTVTETASPAIYFGENRKITRAQTTWKKSTRNGPVGGSAGRRLALHNTKYLKVMLITANGSPVPDCVLAFATCIRAGRLSYTWFVVRKVMVVSINICTGGKTVCFGFIISIVDSAAVDWIIWRENNCDDDGAVVTAINCDNVLTDARWNQKKQMIRFVRHYGAIANVNDNQ